MKTKLIIGAAIFIVIVLGIGGYWGWHTYTLHTYMENGEKYLLDWKNKEALAWYEKASAMGSAKALAMIGFIHYRETDESLKNPAKGYEYSKKAADMGYELANVEIGWDYLEGKGKAVDSIKAKEYFQKAMPSIEKLAKEGDFIAQTQLGRFYFYGYGGVKPDTVKALRLFEDAAEQGYVPAMRNVGIHYFYGDGVTKDETEAIKWYEKAAVKGYDMAYLNLGEAYQFGQQKDFDKAFENYKKAAELGNLTAHFQLANMYFYGIGRPQDSNEAVYWYRKAAEKGNIDAQNSLGTMYHNGSGVTKNLREAKKWYELAANKRDGYALCNLGILYEVGGDGIEKDLSEAANMYKQAAKLGNKTAQLRLAEFYANGYGGLQRNDLEAIQWYRIAAQSNSIDVKYALAEFYENGNAQVKADPALAAKWYYQAAIRGKVEAMRKLMRIYKDGIGVTQDSYEANRWQKNAEIRPLFLNIKCDVRNEKGGIEKKQIRVAFFEKPARGMGITDEIEEVLGKDHNAKMNQDAIDAIQKLYQIAQKNNVSFIKLLEYALKGNK